MQRLYVKTRNQYMDIQDIKLRFGIIGTSPLLDRAIDIARQVAPTNMTVLITGESGTGKESFPKIIHYLELKKAWKLYSSKLWRYT